jgi:hypothetical protein
VIGNPEPTSAPAPNEMAIGAAKADPDRTGVVLILVRAPTVLPALRGATRPGGLTDWVAWPPLSEAEHSPLKANH